MKRLASFFPLLSSSLAFLGIVVVAGCSVKTITEPAPDSPPATEQPGGKEGSTTDPSKTPGSSSGTPEKPEAPKGMGAWEEKGLAIIAGDTQARSTCSDVCKAKGGTCVLGLNPVQGGGSSPIAGIAQYVFVQPGKPAGFIPYDLSTCSSPVPATQESSLDTGSLYKYECSCDDVAVPSRATLKASEGIHACKDVCASWSKTCTNKRTWEDGTEGGAIAFYGESVKAFNCATPPDAKLSTTNLDGYSCACE